MVRFGSKVVYISDNEDIWGNTVTLGNAELAASLGSINRFDRRGDVVWMDDFESVPNKWEDLAGIGVGTSVLSTTRARSGSCSLKITTGFDGGATGKNHQESYPKLSKFGFEASFNLGHSTLVVLLEVRVYTGTNRIRAYIVYDCPNANWRYLDSEGHEQTLLDDIAISYGDYLFTTCKFVLDLDTNKYVRAVLPNQEIDMSTIAAQCSSDTLTAPHIEIRLVAMSSGTASQVVYFDDVIITQNEP